MFAAIMPFLMKAAPYIAQAAAARGGKGGGMGAGMGGMGGGMGLQGLMGGMGGGAQGGGMDMGAANASGVIGGMPEEAMGGMGGIELLKQLLKNRDAGMGAASLLGKKSPMPGMAGMPGMTGEGGQMPLSLQDLIANMRTGKPAQGSFGAGMGARGKAGQPRSISDLLASVGGGI